MYAIGSACATRCERRDLDRAILLPPNAEHEAVIQSSDYGSGTSGLAVGGHGTKFFPVEWLRGRLQSGTAAVHARTWEVLEPIVLPTARQRGDPKAYHRTGVQDMIWSPRSCIHHGIATHERAGRDFLLRTLDTAHVHGSAEGMG
jgi:hypothetical protein